MLFNGSECELNSKLAFLFRLEIRLLITILASYGSQVSVFYARFVVGLPSPFPTLFDNSTAE